MENASMLGLDKRVLSCVAKFLSGKQFQVKTGQSWSIHEYMLNRFLHKDHEYRTALSLMPWSNRTRTH